MSKDNIIVEYHDVVVRESDLDTLLPGEWLNDIIISFHMELIERVKKPKDILFLRPSIVTLINYFEGDNDFIGNHLLSILPPLYSSFIFIPINDGNPTIANSGTHWSLMVYIRSLNQFIHYDTLGQSNHSIAIFTFNRLQSIMNLPKPSQFIEMKTPQQDNCFDCGVHVLSIIDYLWPKFITTENIKDILNIKHLPNPNHVRDTLISNIVMKIK